MLSISEKSLYIVDKYGEYMQYESRLLNRVKDFLSAGEDFHKPVGMTVAAIGLSAVSMGLGLAFVPSIVEMTGESVHKRVKGKEAGLNNLDLEGKKELLNDLATKIEEEMEKNNELRQEVMKLMRDATSSPEFMHMLVKQTELVRGIQSEIRSLEEKFPELQKNVKVIDHNINEVLKQLSQISSDLKDIKEGINPKTREAYFSSYRLGVNLGMIKIVAADTKEAIYDMKKIIARDIEPTARGLDLHIDKELYALSNLDQKFEAETDKEAIWERKSDIIGHIQQIAALRLEKQYGARCADYMDFGVSMGIFALWASNPESVEDGIPIAESCIEMALKLDLPKEYVSKFWNLKKDMDSGQDILDIKQEIVKIGEEIGKYILSN